MDDRQHAVRRLGAPVYHGHFEHWRDLPKDAKEGDTAHARINDESGIGGIVGPRLYCCDRAGWQWWPSDRYTSDEL